MKVAAWDHDASTGDVAVVRVFDVGANGAHEVERMSVPHADRPQVTERFATQGLHVGACDSCCSYVWCGDATGFHVWSKTALHLHAHDGALTLAGVAYRVADFVRVESFAHSEITADHGLRLVDRAGSRTVIAAVVPSTERPAWDPFAGGWAEEELKGHWQWTIWLARDLATALELPYEHVEPR